MWGRWDTIGLPQWMVISLIAICLTFPLAHADEPPPNILFILADDLGYGDLQCYGNPIIDTPVLNALAVGGVRLTNHYAPSPLCAPSRAGFLTGRYNHRTGAVDVPSNRGLDRIDLSERTFGDYFHHAGYATALIGKWHNGLYCREYLPHHRGFDRFIGFPNGGQDYWKWNLLKNDKHIQHDGRYLTDVLNEEAINFVQQQIQAKRRFAVFLSHHAPHPPFQAPEKLTDKYRQRLGIKDGKDDTVAKIYAMIESMDTGLGKVFASLRKMGVWKNTVVVFTSDNGAYLSQYQSGSTNRYHAGLSGNKGDVGEQGIRVPCIVSWPDKIRGGRILSTPIHGCDWLPTLFSLTGANRPPKAKPFDGMNLIPLLQGKSQPQLRNRELPFQKNRYRPAAQSDASLRRGQWKLYWPGVASTMRKDSARDNPSYFRGLIRPHWEMPLDRQLGPVPKFKPVKPRLYNLVTDPAERYNLADKYPKIVAEMADSYDVWFADVMDDWTKARAAILQHDRMYWKDREPPDPSKLFKEFWLWNKAPRDTDPKSTDPLKVFRGYWSNSEK